MTAAVSKFSRCIFIFPQAHEMSLPNWSFVQQTNEPICGQEADELYAAFKQERPKDLRQQVFFE
jgi:hypothetical protein